MSEYEILFRPFRDFVKASDFSLKLLKKCCAGDRVIDLLLYFPISVMHRVGKSEDFSEKDKLTTVIQVIGHKSSLRKTAPYKISGQTASGDFIDIVYFNYNPGFLRRTFPIGATLAVSGNANVTSDTVEIIHPDVITRPEFAKYYIGFEPIYPLTAKLSNRVVIFAIKSLLKLLPEIPEWIPKKFLRENHFSTFSGAIRRIHNPKSERDLSSENKDRMRIAVDELLANQIRLLQLRNSIKQHEAPRLKIRKHIPDALQLPFELTADQKKCLADIEHDLISGKPMNRLIQGDVGSGKTVVCFISMVICIENGMQTALLAPTEILAQQHFETISRFAQKLELKIDLMLSSNRKIREKQIEKLKSGETQILIGTHAILEDNIEFRHLGLIVIDEQHRFGVLQRRKLIEKCNYPNVLAMSATPIPRTLLLGCYGDLDVSIIKTKPAGRKPIKTVVFGMSHLAELLESLKRTDSQIYWICPAVEESEMLVDVNSRCKELCENFSSDDVKILHGKMKPKEKYRIIGEFREKKFKILVSTTVIEVGIDIPSANIMVIEHAERFGLAQLHQLRGRVGRGENEAFCILLYHQPVSGVGKQRLEFMKNTNDGFELSEADLKLRGAGDILGSRQSGFNFLRFSDFSENCHLLELAAKIAEETDINDERAKSVCDIFNRLEQDVIA